MGELLESEQVLESEQEQSEKLPEPDSEGDSH